MCISSGFGRRADGTEAGRLFQDTAPPWVSALSLACLLPVSRIIADISAPIPQETPSHFQSLQTDLMPALKELMESVDVAGVFARRMGWGARRANATVVQVVIEQNVTMERNASAGNYSGLLPPPSVSKESRKRAEGERGGGGLESLSSRV